MKEIQGKSILVRVSARFELGRVRVIGSRLYKLFSPGRSLAQVTKALGNLVDGIPLNRLFSSFFFFGTVKDRAEKADQIMGYRTTRGCHSYEGV